MYAIAFLIAVFTSVGVVTFIDFITAELRRNKKQKRRIRQKRGVDI